MQTDTVQAWQVEDGDVITLGSEATFLVRSIREDNKDEETTGVTFFLEDEDGESGEASFLWFEDISVVTSFEDDE